MKAVTIRRLAWTAALLVAAGAFVATQRLQRDPAPAAFRQEHTRLARPIAPTVALAPVQWCGGSESGADRMPDLVAGPQVHVVYAYPSDGQDRFGTVVHRITTDLAAGDAWWRGQDPVRTPRFDLYAFDGCPTGFGALDVTSLRLDAGSAALAPLGTRLVRIAQSLADASLADDSKKYLIFYDGPVSSPNVCGTAARGPTTRGGFGSVAAVWMRACGEDLGSANVQAAAAEHELGHQLGAVPRGAPNVCGADQGHVCDDPRDLMYPALSANFSELVLDIGKDDYYAHSGTWFDVQDSPFLASPAVTPQLLTVAVRPGARGRVGSEPAGVDCPPACSFEFDAAATVRLVASAAAGSRFLGWSGACAGTGPCTVLMDAAKSVEARFGPSTFQLAVSVAGRGRVLGAAGISCAARCSYRVAADSLVRLRPRPGNGWRFVAWTGSCRGHAACSLRLSARKSVRATFRRVA